MKLILSTVGLFLMTLISLNAQNLEFGIKSGVGGAQIHLTDLPDSEVNSYLISPILSYSINGTLNYRSKGLWGFSIEPGLIKKGWISNKDYHDENKIRLHYLQLPILSDLYLTDNLYFSIGPEINYLLTDKKK